MAPKYQIEVDFDVYRELMLRREREDITFNDVLRGLLGLDQGRLRPEPPPSGSDQRPKPVTIGYELRGRRVALDTAKAVLIGVLRELAQQDAQFPTRLAAIANPRGRTRRYVAQRPEDLYPERPDLVDESAAFCRGWYVITNVSNAEKSRLLEDACEAAGLEWGRDLVVNLG